MNRDGFHRRLRHAFVGIGFVVPLIAAVCPHHRACGKQPTLSPRPPWTTSRVVGSPESPPPYTVEPVFTHVAWKQPVFAIREPGSEWLLVVEWPQPEPAPTQSQDQRSAANPAPQFGPARVTRVRDNADDPRTEPFLELPGRAIYGIEFHPRYLENGQIFVCSRSLQQGSMWTNVLSSFIVSNRDGGNSNRKLPCDPATEERILEWPSQGHDGGSAVFGRDGMLYVALGDGSGDSDEKLTAQDVSTLLGKVLRIDVDHLEAGKKYAVPQDNPFVNVAGARPEIWSLGHRNPWRMTVDARTGGLWVGNNGQDLWEFAHLIQRGDNCGWSVYEGSHPFYLNRQLGPGRLVPPTIEHGHAVFRSLTGGVVYYGHRYPDLAGAYIYGDYATGEIWGAHHDGKRLAWNRELARTTLAIVAFATTHREELLIVDYASGIYRLVESPTDDSFRRFPQKLSETGLFASAAEHRSAPGVVPYVVHVPGWTDGATAERLVALPGATRVRRPSVAQWEFPDGAVLVQTLSLPQRRSGEIARRRIETRLLTKHGGGWSAYSYVWNDEQDDAMLAPAAGVEIDLPAELLPLNNGQPALRKWIVPSRADCLSCHGRAANFVLGFSELQANCRQPYGEVEMNQLVALEQQQVLDPVTAPSTTERPRLVNPYDATQDVELRVRSYLHVNCSVCHVASGGGNSRMLLERRRTARPNATRRGVSAASNVRIASGDARRAGRAAALSAVLPPCAPRPRPDAAARNTPRRSGGRRTDPPVDLAVAAGPKVRQRVGVRGVGARARGAPHGPIDRERSPLFPRARLHAMPPPSRRGRRNGARSQSRCAQAPPK